MNMFSIITGPIGKVLSLILLMAVFGLALGTMNSWYMQTRDAGVVNYERFDRVVLKGDYDTPDEAWAAVTGVVEGDATAAARAANMAYKLAATCGISITGGVIADDVLYTPSGTELKFSTTTGHIAGCEWSKSSKLFQQAGMKQLIEIILQAIGLAGPVFLLTEVGNFARSFTQRMGGGPILSIILTLVVLLLVGTLMGVFIPFLSDAFAAIDSNRFVMYDSGLGKLATVVSSFLGISLVAGLLVLGWSLWKNLRSGNLLAGGSGQRM